MTECLEHDEDMVMASMEKSLPSPGEGSTGMDSMVPVGSSTPALRMMPSKCPTAEWQS